MQNILMILEVSQKQNYIFASRVLKTNINRSEQIARVTRSSYFAQVCPQDYSPHNNLVYSGGGHAVLQFPTKEQADRFARTITRKVLEDYPDMELFVRQMPYDPDLAPGDNLDRLSRLLAEKKYLRSHFFRTHAMGVEASAGITDPDTDPDTFEMPKHWDYPQNMDILDDKDNFLAVVHIDGNAMRSRVQAIYQACQGNWDDCRRRLDLFSTQIDQHFSEAFNKMAQDLANALDQTSRVKALREKGKRPILPLRRIICAGDDVCFMTTGKHGLECAASFLRHLSTMRNRADDKFYTACAGVVLIHKKFPFRQAYDLSEELCRNAKNFCAERGGNISALDFHVEYGQMKDSLSDIRADYISDDGAQLELRPLAVTGADQVPAYRTYEFHARQLQNLSDALRRQEGSEGNLARSKVKSLRTYFRQGKLETDYAIRKTQSARLLDLNQNDTPFFRDDKGVMRCLCFDVIELLDVTEIWRR